MTKSTLHKVYIELSSKYVGMGINYAVLKEKKSGDPFFILFSRGKIIVYEIKQNFKIFNVIFLI